jgi:putative DNA methylase
MSVASPKKGAKNPSNLDSIVVCRRRRGQSSAPAEIVKQSVEALEELQVNGIRVGASDVQSVVTGAVIAELTWDAALIDFDIAKERATDAVSNATDSLNLSVSSSG